MEISPFDPLDRLEPGEHRFVLRQNDRAAPAAIHAWCQSRRNNAFKLYGSDGSVEAERALKAELAQCAEAETIALDWQEAHDNGAADDTEAPVRATYTEVALTEEQVAQANRQHSLKEAMRHMREAAYHLNNAIEADPISSTTEMTMGLLNINTTAETIEESTS